LSFWLRSQSFEWKTMIICVYIKCEACSIYVSKWFEVSIKSFDLVPVFDSKSNRIKDLKIKSLIFRFDLILVDLKSVRIDRKRVHTKTLRCVVNKYIYMHLAYAACAHAKKKNFFVKFIELIRSIWNSFEFCKSDENW
jgi:hypothetical protein